MKNHTMILLISIAALLLVSGCVSDSSTKACVAAGDLVTVQYRGTLDSGELFDEGELQFTAGAGEMISGFDGAVMGMCLGGEKNVRNARYNPPTTATDMVGWRVDR